MANNDFIKLRNISKKFDDVIAVDSLDLDISEGEFFSLLGPSGCGKTTLLRILAGFEYPTTGNVFIDNSEVTNQTPNLRPSNMVFQNYAIFPHINVKRNIEKVISNFISTKIEWVPLNSVQIKNDKQNDLIEFLESLEEDDDVQNIFSNINFGGN